SGILSVLVDVLISNLLDPLDLQHAADIPAADPIVAILFEKDWRVSRTVQRKQLDPVVCPRAILKMGFGTVIFLQGVAVNPDFALILHENNSILPGTNWIRTKNAPCSILDFRLHGASSCARREQVVFARED